MKRTIVSLALGAAVAFAASAAAVSEGPVLSEEAAGSRLPEVFVDEVTLDQRSYDAGDTIRGQATLSNVSGYPALLVLELSVVGDFAEDGLPRKVYATVEGGKEFSLSAGETRGVPFEIVSPAGLDGSGFSVEVFARLVGSVRRGWEYSPTFSIEGDGGYAKVSDARFIGPDGTLYWPTEGPFLYPEEGGTLTLEATLDGGTIPLTLTPVIVVSERAVGSPITRREPAVTVPVGGQAKASFSFLANQTPGVYEGEVSWLGTDGEERATRLPFRYVVFGESATVHAVSISSEAVNRGDPLSVTVSVSGNPLDLRRSSGGAPKTAPASRVVVEVLGPAGERVAEGEQELVLPVIGDLEFGFIAEREASPLRAEVTIYGSKGQLLYARTYPLLEGPAVPSVMPERRAPSPLAAWVFAALAAIALGGAAVSLRRSRKGISLVLAVLALVAWIFAARELKAFTYTSQQSDQWCGSSSIVVNNPRPGENVACGESITIRGAVDYYYCTNSGGTGSATAWVERQRSDGSWEQIVAPRSVAPFSVGITGGHDHPTGRGLFAIPTDMTTRAGTYRVWVQASSDTACVSSAKGFSRFSVIDCDLCANIAGDQNSVPAGMVRDAGGSCVCPSGSTYDTSDGRCEDDKGVCTTCCQAGQKYCDGACVDASAACGTITVNSCPIAPDENQYCVQVFDAAGNQTLPGYTTEDLETIFGFGLREARFDQADAAAAGQVASPIFGVIGRTVSDSGESAGCAGIACSYEVAGCLTLTDIDTNSAIADCTPENDLPGAAGQKPMAKLEVEPSVVGQGGRCEVFWSSHEMRTCQVSGPGVSAATLAGSALTSPLSQTAAYTISCTGIDGQAYSDSDTCSVDPNVTEF